jgi:hypothetical protein
MTPVKTSLRTLCLERPTAESLSPNNRKATWRKRRQKASKIVAVMGRGKVGSMESGGTERGTMTSTEVITKKLGQPRGSPGMGKSSMLRRYRRSAGLHLVQQMNITSIYLSDFLKTRRLLRYKASA